MCPALRKGWPALIVVVTLAGLSCRSKPPPSAESKRQAQVIARINGRPILARDARQRFGALGPVGLASPAAKDSQTPLLEDLVRFELLVDEARRQGYNRHVDVERAMKQQMVALLMRSTSDSAGRIEARPAAVQRYYDEHAAEFTRSERVRVNQIFVTDAGRAALAAGEARALARGDAGGFARLVKKYSQGDRFRAPDGDLAYLTRESTVHPREVVDAAFSLRTVGDVVGPVRSQAGLHVLRLTDRLPGGRRPLAEVEGQIRDRLRQASQKEALEALVNELRRAARVEVFPDRLDDAFVAAPPVGPREPRP